RTHTSLVRQSARPPPTPTLFPYTTLFRSLTASSARRQRRRRIGDGRRARRHRQRGRGCPVASRRAPRRHPDHAAESVEAAAREGDRKSTRLNSSHEWISYAVFCLKKKKET